MAANLSAKAEILEIKKLPVYKQVEEARLKGNVANLIHDPETMEVLSIDGKPGSLLFIGVPFVNPREELDLIETEENGEVKVEFMVYDPVTDCGVYKWSVK